MGRTTRRYTPFSPLTTLTDPFSFQIHGIAGCLETKTFNQPIKEKISDTSLSKGLYKLFFSLSIYVFIYLFIYLLIFSFICLFIYLFVYLFIDIFI